MFSRRGRSRPSPTFFYHMITTIIFDFGGVIATDTIDLFEQKFQFNRLPPKKRVIYENAVKQCELGRISRQGLFVVMREIFTPHLSTTEIERWLLDHAKTLPPYRLIGKLRKNYRIMIISNNFKHWPAKMCKSLDITLTGIPFVNSALIGSRKQDGAAFRYAIKEYKLDPSSCVFIDDRPYNIKPAKHLEFKTILYKGNITDLKSQLKKAGITTL